MYFGGDHHERVGGGQPQCQRRHLWWHGLVVVGQDLRQAGLGQVDHVEREIPAPVGPASDPEGGREGSGSEAMTEAAFRVTGIHCQSCERSIRTLLEDVDGIEEVAPGA